MILAGSGPDVECPLCKARETIAKRGYQHIMPGDWSLAACLRCGTSFIAPMPDAGTLAKYYDEDYYGPGESKFIGPVERITWLFRFLRARVVKRLQPRGRILDVGCGRGVMLKVLKQWGYCVDGIELGNAAALRAEKNIGQPIYRSLEQLAANGAKRYEVISFWHSLEHLPDPHRVLQITHQLLSPGGFLIIAAPNMACRLASLSGKNWLHLDLPRHLTHFDMLSLARFLEKEGYRIIRHSHFSQEYNPIDALCFIFELLGFGDLYPYRMVTSSLHSKGLGFMSAPKMLFTLILLPPLTILAILAAGILSLLGSGSTSTLIVRKPYSEMVCPSGEK